MFKRLTIILLLALLVIPVMARNTGLVYHAVQVKDEVGTPVTTISSVEIYNAGTTTDAVIYSDAGLRRVITIPMTTTSPNSTLVDGKFFWWGPEGWEFSITDGSNTATNSGHRTRTATDGLMIFPTYLTSITTSQYNDNVSITFGTSGDFVPKWDSSGSFLSWVPLADGAPINFGTSGTTKNVDFNVFVGTALGLKIDEDGISFTWDGGTCNLNVNDSSTTNINTGSSTGPVNIGSGTSGAVALDTTTTIALNADDGITLDTTEAGADIVLDATAGSILLDSGQNVALAISLITNTGSSETIVVTNTQGTGAGAIEVTATAGSLDFNAGDNVTIDAADDITLDTVDGGISLIADGASNGDIIIDAEDALTITVGGTLSFEGSQLTYISQWVESVTAQTNVLTAIETGKLTRIVYTGTHTTTLPDAAAGLVFHFVDGSKLSADDVVIDPQSGDNIDGDTNGDAIESVTDAVGQSITLVALNGTDWVTVNVSGTWGQQ